MLPENPSSPKLPTFMVARRLGYIKFASVQNNRPMSCQREPCLPLFSQIIPRFGANMWQMLSFFPVRKFSLHQSKTRFADLEEDLCLVGSTSNTPPHRAPLSTASSIAQRKMQWAGCIACLYSAITRSFFIQNSPKLQEMPAMLLSL